MTEINSSAEGMKFLLKHIRTHQGKQPDIRARITHFLRSQAGCKATYSQICDFLAVKVFGIKPADPHYIPHPFAQNPTQYINQFQHLKQLPDRLFTLA